MSNQIQLRKRASYSYCARSWCQQTNPLRKKIFHGVENFIKQLVHTSSVRSSRYEAPGKFWRALQTCCVLHISMNARWRMNQLLSESYLGNVHGEPTIEGYQYCMGLKRAFESLISQWYRSYILVVGCIAVGISYCADNGHFKVFDSHARDVYGKSHTWGTCGLLDLSSTDNLARHFQSLNGATDLYELKG